MTHSSARKPRRRTRQISKNFLLEETEKKKQRGKERNGDKILSGKDKEVKVKESPEEFVECRRGRELDTTHTQRERVCVRVNVSV